MEKGKSLLDNEIGVKQAGGVSEEKVNRLIAEFAEALPQYETGLHAMEEQYKSTLPVEDACCFRAVKHVTDPQSDSQTDPQSDPQISLQVKNLLKVMGGGEYSVTELMEIVGLKHKSHFRKVYLNPAIESGLVVMTHPEQKNHRSQKYKKV